jgi:hypothetical protein
MAVQTQKTGGLGLLLLLLAALVVLVAAASLLLPTTVGRLVADLWVGVMTSIGQLFGG